MILDGLSGTKTEPFVDPRWRGGIKAVLWGDWVFPALTDDQYLYEDHIDIPRRMVREGVLDYDTLERDADAGVLLFGYIEGGKFEDFGRSYYKRRV